MNHVHEWTPIRKRIEELDIFGKVIDYVECVTCGMTAPKDQVKNYEKPTKG